jgi:hypothetical protein
MCVAHLTSKRRSNICSSSSSGIRSSTSSRGSGSTRSGRHSSCGRETTTPSRSGRQRLTDMIRSFLGQDANVVYQHIAQVRLFEKWVNRTRHKNLIATRKRSARSCLLPSPSPSSKFLFSLPHRCASQKLLLE